jgi:hypothetical protein
VKEKKLEGARNSPFGLPAAPINPREHFVKFFLPSGEIGRNLGEFPKGELP